MRIIEKNALAGNKDFCHNLMMVEPHKKPLAALPKKNKKRLFEERYLTLDGLVIREKKQKPIVIEFDFSLFPNYVSCNVESFLSILISNPLNTHIFKLQRTN